VDESVPVKLRPAMFKFQLVLDELDIVQDKIETSPLDVKID
jgi:hypothetical protein